jgi:hypothetical protein
MPGIEQRLATESQKDTKRKRLRPGGEERVREKCWKMTRRRLVDVVLTYLSLPLHLVVLVQKEKKGMSLYEESANSLNVEVHTLHEAFGF